MLIIGNKQIKGIIARGYISYVKWPTAGAIAEIEQSEIEYWYLANRTALERAQEHEQCYEQMIGQAKRAFGDRLLWPRG